MPALDIALALSCASDNDRAYCYCFECYLYINQASSSIFYWDVQPTSALGCNVLCMFNSLRAFVSMLFVLRFCSHWCQNFDVAYYNYSIYYYYLSYYYYHHRHLHHYCAPDFSKSRSIPAHISPIFFTFFIARRLSATLPPRVFTSVPLSQNPARAITISSTNWKITTVAKIETKCNIRHILILPNRNTSKKLR